MLKNLYAYPKTLDFKIESYHTNINVVLHNICDCPTVLKCHLICSESYDIVKRGVEEMNNWHFPGEIAW